MAKDYTDTTLKRIYECPISIWKDRYSTALIHQESVN